MLKKTMALAVAAVLALGASSASAEKHTYKIDPVHSSIAFSVKHMVISNVKGSFDAFSGTIVIDTDKIENSSVEVEISTASLNTKNEKRDGHVKSPDFLDVQAHPTITFKSERVKKAGDAYVAVGDLTIRGVSKRVELPFSLNGPIKNPWGQVVIGVEAAYKLSRREFGVSWSQTLDNGGLVVGDDVKIELNIEAQKS